LDQSEADVLHEKYKDFLEIVREVVALFKKL